MIKLNSIGTKIAGAFLLLLVAFAVFALIAINELTSSAATEGLVSKSHAVMSQIAQVSAAAAEIQSSARGYALTGDEARAESVEWGRLELLQGLEELRTQTMDSTEQRAGTIRLGPLADKFISFYLSLVAMRKSEGLAPAVSLANTDEGQQTTESFRAVLLEMRDAEDQLLETRNTEAHESMGKTRRYLALSAALAISFGVVASIYITRRIVKPVALLVEGTERIGGGDFDHRVLTSGNDEIEQLGEAFNQMAARLQQSHHTVAEQDWLKGCLVRITSQLQGQRDISEAGRIVMTELAEALDARYGVLYLRERDANGEVLVMRTSYGAPLNPGPPARILPGDGLIGQCLRQRRRIIMADVPQGYLQITSSLGTATPATIILQPAMFEGDVEAILELASFKPFLPVHLALLDQLGDSLGVGLHTIHAAQRTEELLRSSQQLATKLAENARQLSERNTEVERKNTEVEEARLALEERAEQLSRSNGDLEQFAYVASHDLQEPLRAVGGFASMLERQLHDRLDDSNREYFKHIVDGVTRMKSLIADLLAFSRLNRGETFQEVDCEQVFHIALENLALSIAASKALVTHQPLPTLLVDRTQFCQLLQNLVSNAIKFASSDSPAIHVGCDLQDDGSWRFSVSDNGIGIAPEFAERIFVIFQRLHTREQYPGTGIGLAICKKIVERHGGRIWVESEPGKGATFYFTIATQNHNTPTSPL